MTQQLTISPADSVTRQCLMSDKLDAVPSGPLIKAVSLRNESRLEARPFQVPHTYFGTMCSILTEIIGVNLPQVSHSYNVVPR